jgi:F-type H+-transporting ATPase subunit b
MPQITQLSYVFASQLFWLAIIFGLIFFGIGRGMLPKIQGTVELREKKIADDLNQAQAARAEADEKEAGWRARMDASRAEAARLGQEAKQASAKDTEAKVKKAADKINAKVETAEARIREALDAARVEIEAVAAEASQDIVARLTGIKVGKQEAAAAVKAEINV